MTALTVVLVALAVLVALPRDRRPAERLVPLRRASPPAGRVVGARVAARARHAAGLVAGVAVALLLGGPVGAALGAAAAALLPRALGRLEPAAVRQQRRRLEADLPLALDLLAACLAGGATLPGAAQAVGAAFEGPLGDRLVRVSRALAVGSPPEEAWAALAPEPDDPLAPVARALVRSARSGAPVAAAVVRVADQARAAARSRGERAVRRAGVLAVGPLAVCFLPAFVLVGVVPVVVGLVGPLLQAL